MLTWWRGSPSLRDRAHGALTETRCDKRAAQGDTGNCRPATSVGQSHSEHPEQGEREKQKQVPHEWV